MPRAPLQRRLGAALLTRLDQALGRAAEPFDPIVPEEPLYILLRFLEPIATAEAIAEAAGEAVRRLVPLLAGAGLGMRRLLPSASASTRKPSTSSSAPPARPETGRISTVCYAR